MKKTLTTLFMTFAVAFTVLLVSGTTSKALETWNANITQTDAGEQSVELKWDAYLGADHYEIFFSTDNNNWVYMDYATGTSTSIYQLTSSSRYYVKLVAYSGSYYSDSKTPIAESGSVDVITSPEEVQGLKQTDATTSTITMSWNNMPGADGYMIYRYDSYGNYTNLGSSAKNSFTIKGLQASTRAAYFVLAVKLNSAGQSAYSTPNGFVYMRTAPAKVAYVSMTNFWSYSNSASFGWNSVNNVDGYQFQLQDYKGKSILTKDTSSTSISADPFKKGIFTKARCRAYIVVNNKRIYGAWSGYDYNASCSNIKVIRSANRKKITLKWSKIKGASGYGIYVSTKSESGYKKVKTVKAKTTKYSFTKFKKKALKKNQRYYIRIKYLTKVGKKTVTSGIAGSGSI